MNKSVLFRIFSLLLIVLYMLPGSLFAGNETKWTAPVQITLGESILKTQPVKIHLKIQVEKPAGSKQFTVVPVEDNEFIEMAGTSRTGGMKDGKVDVDIIIRYEDMVTNTKEFQAGMPTEIRVVAFKIEFITVDNISGVVVSNEVPDMNMGGARLTGISIEDSQGSPAPVENAVSFGKISIAPANVSESNSQSNTTFTPGNLRLYPIPVLDGLLNVEIPTDIQVKSLSIHNALGATVRKINLGEMPGIITIPVQELESGIYFLRIISADSRQEIVKRFMVRN